MFESAEERRKFDKLCELVEDISKKVGNMDVLLRGKDYDLEPSGIKFQVAENTKNIKNAKRFLWHLTIATSGLVLMEILKLF